MQEIKMLPELLQKIRDGKKTATTRLGLKPYVLGPVKFVSTEGMAASIENVEIYKLEQIAFCEISDELARVEGYKNAKELERTLTDIYGYIDDYTTLTIVYFYYQG